MTQQVAIEQRDVFVIDTGMAGPQGAPGASGDTTITKVAGEAISAYRAVVTDTADEVLLADNTDSTHRTRVLGVTTGASIEGDEISVKRFGALENALWAWTPDALIFVGTAGALTQTPPASPAVFSQAIAVATSPTTIFVWPREAVTIS